MPPTLAPPLLVIKAYDKQGDRTKLEHIVLRAVTRHRYMRARRGNHKTQETVKPGKAKYILPLIVVAACVGVVIIPGTRVALNVMDSALETVDRLPFVWQKQLRRTYGPFFDLVHAGTAGIPMSIEPRIRSGARMIVGEAHQVRQKFPHHGTAPNHDLYIILCQGISGYTIKPEFINAPYPLHNQPRRTSELPVPENTPLTFPFTTGIDVDTLEAATIAVRASPGTQCQFQLLDTRPTPPAVMAETSSTVASTSATTINFPAPVQLEYSHGATPYLLRLTFSRNVQIGVSAASRPDQRVIVGDTVHKDMELTGSIMGRLVDARSYTLMQTPVHNGFIYGKTAVLQELGITPPYSADDIAAIGSHVLQQSGEAE